MKPSKIFPIIAAIGGGILALCPRMPLYDENNGMIPIDNQDFQYTEMELSDTRYSQYSYLLPCDCWTDEADNENSTQTTYINNYFRNEFNYFNTPLEYDSLTQSPTDSPPPMNVLQTITKGIPYANCIFQTNTTHVTIRTNYVYKYLRSLPNNYRRRWKVGYLFKTVVRQFHKFVEYIWINLLQWEKVMVFPKYSKTANPRTYLTVFRKHIHYNSLL